MKQYVVKVLILLSSPLELLFRGKPNHFGEVKNAALIKSVLCFTWLVKFTDYKAGRGLVFEPGREASRSLQQFSILWLFQVFGWNSNNLAVIGDNQIKISGFFGLDQLSMAYFQAFEDLFSYRIILLCHRGTIV